MVPGGGAETKNDCVSEGRQQITALLPKSLTLKMAITSFAKTLENPQ
jgi:hypothetical protein